MKKVLTILATLISIVAAANVAGACVCVFYQPEVE
ncbi:MAG: cyclic lactone autoinducer peptide [Firmicutes bacterium]|nr:cyclic lactone autoinducer peptide [Bacillota bacterium]